MKKRLQEIFNDLAAKQARKTAIDTQLRSGEEVDLDALDKEVDTLNGEIEVLEEEQKTIERKLEMAGRINAGQTNEFRQINTPNGSEERNMPNILATMEYRNAFMDFVLRDTPIPTEYRATTLTTDIGELIPETVMNTIIEKLEATGMILPLITRTSIRGGVTVPTSNLKPVASWVAEGAGSAKQKKTLSDAITFAYHKLRCAVASTLEVETMALSAFETKFINNVVEAMIKAVEQAIISGSGIGQPKGILTETPVSGQAFDVTSIKYEVLTEAEGALPIEYEDNAVWAMTKRTFMKFISMTDLDGQPIARVNYGLTGKPERYLLGRQVILNNYMDTYSDTLEVGKPFAFLFDFSDYALNTNYEMTIKKYEDHDTDDWVTKAIMLTDGKVLDKNSLVVLNKAGA